MWLKVSSVCLVHAAVQPLLLGRMTIDAYARCVSACVVTCEIFYSYEMHHNPSDRGRTLSWPAASSIGRGTTGARGHVPPPHFFMPKYFTVDLLALLE